MLKVFRILRFTAIHYNRYKKFLRLSPELRNSSQYPADLVDGILHLGPLFIKIGQILSTRKDILPLQYTENLALLQENVSTIPFEQIDEILQQNFDHDTAKYFQSIEKQPVASASLAQVHFGVLKNGKKVALKIRKPYTKERIITDLNAIRKLLKMAQLLIPRKLKKSNVVAGFREFERYTLLELDFLNEAETIERFRENFSSQPEIKIPQVYHELSSEKVLVMEQIHGKRLKEILIEYPEDEKFELAKKLAEMQLKMFISDGIFHADLHPGNIFFRESNIFLLDFGMYGELTIEQRNRFILYWLAVANKNIKKAFYHFKKQCVETENSNEEKFFETFESLAIEFYQKNLIDASITKTYLEMIKAGIKFGFKFPENLLLHAKALTTAEALIFELAPTARYDEITKPLIIQEFTKIGLSRSNLNRNVFAHIPEFLMGQDVIKDLQPNQKILRNSTSNGMIYSALIQQLEGWISDYGGLKSLLNEGLKEILKEKQHISDINTFTDSVWEEYERLEKTIANQKTIGGTLTIHLAALSHAMYNCLLNNASVKEAVEIVYKCCWYYYDKMSDVPLVLAGLLTKDKMKKMEMATILFRKFPFSSPDYIWEDVSKNDCHVAFNCNRCHVANYFLNAGLGDLCYQTWCKLDFPLAEKWGGKLERKSSIANGAEVCDFKWMIE